MWSNVTLNLVLQIYTKEYKEKISNLVYKIYTKEYNEKIQVRSVMFSLLFASLPSAGFDIFFRCLFCSIPTFGWTLQGFCIGTQMMSSLPLKNKLNGKGKEK